MKDNLKQLTFMEMELHFQRRHEEDDRKEAAKMNDCNQSPDSTVSTVLDVIHESVVQAIVA